MKFLGTTAFIALLAATSPALAQTAPQTTPDATPDATPAPGGLEEIIVTAQRRNESLQKASVAVTAISGESLTTQVAKAEDLTRLVPSATITLGGGGASITTIRGIGTLASNGLAEQVVAFNLDGVYLARPAAVGGQFYDLERVEVLKGPQGTLYGRNATAGAINLITKKPTFTPEAEFSGQVGSYNLLQGQGSVNVPVSDKVAVRVAGQAIDRNGYLSDGYNDQKQYSGRATLLAHATDELTLMITGDYTHIGGKGAAGVLSPLVDPGNPYLGPSEAASNKVYTSFVIPGRAPNGLPPIKADGYSNNNFYGITGSAELDSDFGKITILPAYRRSNLDYRQYAAGFQVDDKEKSDATSLEVRYATPSTGPFSLVIGGYYFKESGEFTLNPYVFSPAGVAPPYPSTTYVTYDTRALAAFGQATYSITDAIRLIGGLRYNNEKKTDAGTARNSFTNVITPFTGALEFNRLNWRAGVETDLSATSFLYATVSTGFKAGGFFPAAGDNSFKPETLTAYSIGSKNRFLGNRLQVNLELFYWKYKDKQVTHLEAGVLRVDNAGSATLYGAELESSLLVTPHDRLSLNVLYNKTKYDTYSFLLAKTAAWNCARTTVNSSTDRVDCSGNALLQAPLWTINGGYEHTFHFNNGANIVATAAGQMRSSYWTSDEQLAGMKQSTYFQGDLDLTYHAPDKRWSLGAYVRNVTDQAVMSNGFVTSGLGRAVVNLQAPRTYGVTFGVKFR